jgi:hypothetical protein
LIRFSNGTVIFSRELPPFRLAFTHRGWGVDTHSIFTRGPQGSFAAAKNVLRPFRFVRRHTETAPGGLFVSTVSIKAAANVGVSTACQTIFDVIGDLITHGRQLEQLVLDDRIVGLLGLFPIHGRFVP